MIIRLPRVRFLVAAIMGALIAIAIAATASAQSSRDARRPESGRGFFEVGYMKLNLGALNDALAPAGFPNMQDGFLTIGGSGFAEHGRFFVGGEGKGLIGRRNSTVNGAFDLALGGGYGLFRIGYKVYDKHMVDVFPTVGIGGSGVQLDIRGRSAPTFGNVLASPARSSRLSSGGLLLGFGLDANCRIKVPSKRTGEEGGFLVGASAGYLLSPGTGEWKLDGINTVAGGPEAKVEGFYVRVAFGGWGRRQGAN